MKQNVFPIWRQYDTLLSFLVLVFLLAYTYGLLFVAPYPGFYFNPSNGEIIVIYRSGSSTDALAVGDFIEHFGRLSFDDFVKDRTLNPFQDVRTGEPIEIQVRRNGETHNVAWIYPGFNRVEFLSRFFNVWWLAYIFWAIGMAAQLIMRPRNTQRRLFVASTHLTALFLMFGSISSYHVMMGSTLLRMVAWILLPVYIHFHWIFPQSFRRIFSSIKIVFYILFGAIGLGELLQIIPSTLYFLAVSLAFGGSLVLLLFHFLLQPAQRPQIRFLSIGAFLALFPIILVGVISSGGRIPESGPLALLALPILPGAYFYVLYRRSLGGLELRTNRAISLYIFLIILLTALLLVVGSTGLADISREIFIFATVIITLLTTFAGILLFPAFQAFVERRLLGIKLPAKNMIESFSARIVTSTTLPDLLKLLDEQVFPSLLIRQVVFLQFADSSSRILLARDVDPEKVGVDAVREWIASDSEADWVPLPAEDRPFGWVRLVLPLKIGPDLIGAWLLGRRDPDDLYPQAELPTLRSLADQTAIALSNILQTERLKMMYEANIHRYEEERLRLAHELHDSLLNEMAAMLMKHDPDALPREFQESFDGLIFRLREIVKDLRPPMLSYGLKYALDGLADNLSERTHDTVQIRSDVRAAEDCRYPEIVERNLYRIVQESCENALKYARARSIHIAGELTPRSIDLHVVDDGIGFKEGIDLRLEDMVINKHYGLAGMQERAGLIGAAIKFDSEQNMGTQIQVHWESKDSI